MADRLCLATCGLHLREGLARGLKDSVSAGEPLPAANGDIDVPRVNLHAVHAPADGLAIAKTSFSLVEQTMAYAGEEATGYLVHAFATNLRFEEDEFNFVKERARHGTSAAFELRDEHFTVPSDGA